MKMTRQPLILAASLAAVLALSACGKKDESAAPAPSTTPPAATAAAPAPSSTAPMAMNNAPAAVMFSSVEPSNKILASGTSFAPKDSIYASVDTSGSGNATLAAKWTYQDGQVVHEDSKTLNAAGPAITRWISR